MSDTCAVDQADGPLTTTTHSATLETVVNKRDSIEAMTEKLVVKDYIIGDIIEISYEEDYEEITIWALYVGDGSVMYLLSSSDNIHNYRLLRSSLEVLTQNKTHVVNNLDEFAQTRGLSPQKPIDIQRTAEEVYKKYSNEVLRDRNHNLRIHFVTKCRFGRGFCAMKDKLEEESTIFKI